MFCFSDRDTIQVRTPPEYCVEQRLSLPMGGLRWGIVAQHRFNTADVPVSDVSRSFFRSDCRSWSTAVRRYTRCFGGDPLAWTDAARTLARHPLRTVQDRKLVHRPSSVLGSLDAPRSAAVVGTRGVRSAVGNGHPQRGGRGVGTLDSVNGQSQEAGGLASGAETVIATC